MAVPVPAFEPTRAKWYGVRTSNPTNLTGADEGAWWFRSDVELFAYWDGEEVRYIGANAGYIDSGTVNLTIPVGGGSDAGTITFTYPTGIQYVYGIYVTAVNPTTHDVYTPIAYSISGNVVGITLGGVTGTTAQVTAVTSGY